MTVWDNRPGEEGGGSVFTGQKGVLIFFSLAKCYKTLTWIIGADGLKKVHQLTVFFPISIHQQTIETLKKRNVL